MSVASRPAPTISTDAISTDASIPSPRSSSSGLRGLRRGMALTDLGVLLVALTAAHAIRFPRESGSAADRSALDLTYLLGGSGIVVLWMALLATMRSRDPRIIGVGGDEYRRLLTASLVTGATVAVLSYATGIDLARGFVAVAFPLGLVLLCAGRKAWRTSLVRSRGSGRHLDDVLLVGELDDARYVGRRIAGTPAAGYRVRGVATDCADVGSVVDLGSALVPVLGRVDDVLEIARDSGAGAVVLAGTVSGGHERLRRLGWRLEELGMDLVVSSPLVDVAEGRVHHRPVDGLPLMHVERPDHGRRPGKRVLDLVGAGLGLLVLAPVLAVVAVAVLLDDRGPVFFRQARVGRGGETFSILKFRTMAVGSETQVAALERLDEGAGPLFKIRDDPRVTRVGAFLRRTSIDELPQLWNVLTGSMSLVGPRPALPREVALYADFVDRRLLVPPGITGLWQVSGRSDLDWAEGVRLDLHYVENWSFAHDLVILGRTIPSVLRSRGAY